MPWIRTPKPGPDTPALREALTAVRAGLPPEYAGPGSERLPAAVRADSIVLSHGLLPEVLRGFFSAYNALMDPSLPLTRREHELIAVVVSDLNDCFY